MSRTIYDIKEEQLDFINQYIADVCNAIYPQMTEEDLLQEGKLVAVSMEEGIYNYFLDKKTPLLCVDLNLLIDGV